MKKEEAHKKEVAWAITVAAAAPTIPHLKPKINKASKIVFVTAPISIVHMANRGKLQARIKLFSVMFVIMKTEPRQIMLKYVFAYGMIVGVAPYSRSKGSAKNR